MERRISIEYNDKTGCFAVDVYGDGRWRVSKLFKADATESMSAYIESWLIEGIIA